MKKLFILVALVSILFSSCGNKNEYSVFGTVMSDSLNGNTVYLMQLDSAWNFPVVIDSTIIESKLFTFKGIANETPQLRMVKLANEVGNMQQPVPFLLEAGRTSVTLDTVSIVRGSAINEQFNTFYTQSNALYKEARHLYKQVKTTNDATALTDFSNQIFEKENRYANEMFAFVQKNATNDLGAWLLVQNGYIFDDYQLKASLDALNAPVRAQAPFRKMDDRLALLQATKVGAMYTDLKAKAPNGTTVALSDYVGKNEYVLIDFWASWCPPCRADMPNLVEAYSKYKDKGFTIVGVSLDSNFEAWQRGIVTLKITWPQMSTLEAKSSLKDVYGVGGIPHTVLIDRTGTIIARGLHGKQVLAEMEKRLK